MRPQTPISDEAHARLDLDVQGARNMKRIRPETVTVFLLPPSMETLENRLRNRDTDSEETIRVRLQNAVEEIAQCRAFDYMVVNDDLGRTIRAVETVIRAERLRVSAQRIVLDHEPQLDRALSDASQ
jgi:guanylate kinase